MLQFDTLQTILIGAAIVSIFLSLKNLAGKEWKVAGAFAATGLVLLLAIFGRMSLNNSRLNGNKDTLEKSSIIQNALSIFEKQIDSARDYKQNPLNLNVKEPWIIIPFEKDSNGHLRITNEDSTSSRGGRISEEIAENCKTILFYETSIMSEFYTSPRGSTSSGESVQRRCYLYDIGAARIFDYEWLRKELPTTTKGSPHLEVTMKEIISWLKEKK